MPARRSFEFEAHLTRIVPAVMVALCTAVSVSAAQDNGCTYDRCALRLKSSFSGVRIVSGREYVSAARLGMFPPRVPVLEQGGDSVRVHYDTFRSKQKTGAGLQLAGLGLLVVGVAMGELSGADKGGPFLLGAIGFTFAGSMVQRSGKDHLSQAIWWYNRDLPR